MSRTCAVLGRPIAHSLSPDLHRAAYAALGLDWDYERHEVDEAGLAAFLDRLGPRWRGLSLTMPLKRVALASCDEVSDVARTVDAVNTVLLDDDGGRRGDNTDVPGMVAALAERGVRSARTALILGVGATACSATAALAELGVEKVTALARDPARGATVREVAGRVGMSVEVSPWTAAEAGAEVVVSTVPAAAAETVGTLVVRGARVVFDAIYDPWPTPLARSATDAGVAVVSGLDLLVHQAALQVELMTGRRPAPLAAMRAAGEAALAARHAG